MIEHRPHASLGKFRNEWLAANHHFSFSEYRDPERMNWGALRVWNDDAIQPHTGFAPHPHADMEIITYVRQGAISHQDSLGNKGRTAAGDVQVMSAGRGIRHSEMNLEDDVTRLFQIWIIPRARGGDPSWGAAQFPKGARAGKFVALASGFEDEIAQGALPIRQDARVLGATIDAGQTVDYAFAPDRLGYLAVAAGRARIGDRVLEEGDAAAISGETAITIEALGDGAAEIVLVDTI